MTKDPAMDEAGSVPMSVMERTVSEEPLAGCVQLVEQAATPMGSRSEETRGETGGMTADKNGDAARHRPRLSDVRFIMVLVGFGMAFVGSQVQPLLFAAIFPLVAAELNATNLLVWFFCTPLMAVGVSAPFAGPLADLFGRKRITIAGVLASMAGMILVAATPTAAGYIAGQVFTGIGIAVQELMAISAIVEIVPTRYRGYYTAMVVASFVPFAPASLYGALIAQSGGPHGHGWRYCACLVAVWNAVTAGLVAVFYNPPARPNGAGLTWRQKCGRIDFVGGLLMAAGLVLFLVGFDWGGLADYPWRSARVIAFLTAGGALIVLFFVHEALWAAHPMFPRRLVVRHPRTFLSLMVVIMMAGVNYIPVLFFWVLQAVAVYDSDRTELGIRTLPFGFCIMGGALLSAVLVSAFRGHLRTIMSVFCVVQATAIGCLAAVDTHNLGTAWPPLILGLTAVGGILIPNQIIVTVICPDDLIATATCLTVSLRAVGQVVGMSIFYTQFVSTLTAHTLQTVIPVAVNVVGILNITTLENMMPTLLAMPWKEWAPTEPALDTPEKLSALHDAVVQAFGAAFPRVYFISIAFGVVAVVASFFIEDLGTLMDEHIAVHYF